MWAYSVDEKYFFEAGKTRESAIAAAAQECQDDLDEYRRIKGNPDLQLPGRNIRTVYVGECTMHIPKYSKYRNIADELTEQAYEEDFGDSADDWLSGISKEQVQELNDAVDAAVDGWLKKYHLEPMFFKVCSWEPVEITLK